MPCCGGTGRCSPRRTCGRQKPGIDSPLLLGAALFGAGWGLAGLCPGPAIANLATLAPGVIVFVVAMAAGMVGHDLWQARTAAAAPRDMAQPSAADG